MTASARRTTPPRASRLEEAHALLDAGDLAEARWVAQSVVADAENHGRLEEAHALAFLAHCDRIDSRLRRASETARRAARLFAELGDPPGEAGALLTVAHVSMLLGRVDEAIEAALMSVRMCDTGTPRAQTVLAYNVLGLAFSWGGDHQRAHTAFERSVAAARECRPAVGVYQPRINQVWAEASRLIDERFETGSMKSLDRMEQLLRECHRLESSGEGAPMLPGLRAMARTLSLASTVLLEAWCGRLEPARAALRSAAGSLASETTWLDAFVSWCAAEVAWAASDWAATEIELVRMRELALSVENEQLACRAHLLLAHVLELQGKYVEAVRQHRELWRRKRSVLADEMTGRESLVAWQWGARKSERHLQQALLVSKRFERWSMEDALTGIANRRHFEQAVAERVGSVDQGTPLAVAMVDVDRFKSVNDRFTHSVGDRVLKTVAAIMSSHVRHSDLPARWAGDEFVILFVGADEEKVRQICDRIRQAVRDFDWFSVAVDLQVTVSIGMSTMRPEDTLDEALQRSDESMYRAKGDGRHALAEDPRLKPSNG